MAPSTGANGTITACDSGCTEAGCLIAGILIHVIGSVGINLGQNMQALALSNGGLKFKDPTWNAGMALFAVASVVTFGALALASATILVPLEAIQFVVNIAFNRIVRKKPVTGKMYGGTFLIISGIVMVCVFGSNDEAQSHACYTPDKLKTYWEAPAWWVYCGVTFTVAAVTYVLWRKLTADKIAEQNRWEESRDAIEATFAKGQDDVQRTAGMHKLGPYPEPKTIEAIAFTLSASLAGGGQMIVHTKLVAELLEYWASTGDQIVGDWFLWCELLCVLVFGVYWLTRLTECLGYYDPLFIIPLMQTAFIIFGAVAGGIFFKEFDHLHKHNIGEAAWAYYILGLLMAVGGLTLIAPPTTESDTTPTYKHQITSSPQQLGPSSVSASSASSSSESPAGTPISAADITTDPVSPIGLD